MRTIKCTLVPLETASKNGTETIKHPYPMKPNGRPQSYQTTIGN